MKKPTTPKAAPKAAANKAPTAAEKVARVRRAKDIIAKCNVTIAAAMTEKSKAEKELATALDAL